MPRRIVALLWLPASAALSAAATLPVQETRSPAAEVSLEDTQARAKSDLARRLKVKPEEIQVLESEERAWPDAGLGCLARRGLLGRSPVLGYRFVLALGDRRFAYHADRRGKLLPCHNPGKPVDRINTNSYSDAQP